MCTEISPSGTGDVSESVTSRAKRATMRMPLNWSSLKRMPLKCPISYYSTVNHECTINEGCLSEA